MRSNIPAVTKNKIIMAIDIMFVIMVLIGFYIGFSRGIIKTVLSVLSIIFGIIAGFKFAGPMETFLIQATGQDRPIMFVVGFLLSFAIVMILIRMLAKGLESILQSANINIINHCLLYTSPSPRDKRQSRMPSSA